MDNKFKYLGSIVTDAGPKPEMLAMFAQTITAFTRLSTIWRDKNVTLLSKIRLVRILVLSSFPNGYESWTLSADTEKDTDNGKEMLPKTSWALVQRPHLSSLMRK